MDVSSRHRDSLSQCTTEHRFLHFQKLLLFLGNRLCFSDCLLSSFFSLLKILEPNQSNLQFHFYILIYKRHLVIYKHSLSVASRAETNTNFASYPSLLSASFLSELSRFRLERTGWSQPGLGRVRIAIMICYIYIRKREKVTIS